MLGWVWTRPFFRHQLAFPARAPQPDDFDHGQTPRGQVEAHTRHDCIQRRMAHSDQVHIAKERSIREAHDCYHARVGHLEVLLGIF